MYQRCKSNRRKVRKVFQAIGPAEGLLLWPLQLVSARMLAAAAIAFAFVVFGLSGVAHAQNWQTNLPSSVSSDEFLQELPTGSLPADPSVLSQTIAERLTARNHTKSEATKAAYLPTGPAQLQETATTAQFETPVTATESIIGSGVAIAPHQPVPPQPTNSPMTLPPRTLGWPDRLGLDPTHPNFIVGYESIHFRRSNDSVGPYSLGGGFDRFDQDVSGRYTFSRILGNIDRIDFKFTGPFHWDRQSSAIGPVNSNLPATFASAFDGADLHHQSHAVRLSSYELNRSESGDELSKYFYGLRFFDHEERYRLEATQGALVNQFRLDTNNFLAGGQIGMNFFRPMSQRLSIGFGTALGLYGNFASGFLNATSGMLTTADAKENRLRITSMFEGGGLVNFRVSQHIVASGGYECWYFSGLATAAGQPLANSAQKPPFTLQMGDDQLFRGWTVGVSARF